MNRSRLSETFPVSGLVPGETVLVSRFVHPSRGVVHCPAAPALAGWLRARGASVRIVDLCVEAAPALEDGPVREGAGKLVSTTYLDPGGRAVGLAAAAGPGPDSLAREVVEAWSATLRTRRVLVPVDPRGGARRPRPGAVPGTRRADLSEQAQRHAAEPWCPGAVHGCELARATWRSASLFQARGDTTLLVGSVGADPASAGVLPVDASAGLVAVTTVGRAAQVQVPDEGCVSFVLRPCAVVEEAVPVLRALRSRFPMLRGQHPDQWCYRASDAVHALRRVAEGSDLVLVLGARDPGLSWPAGISVRYLTGFEQLVPEDLCTAATVAVVDPYVADCGGPRGGEGLTVADVIAVVAGLGPLSVVHHQARTETTSGVFGNSPQGAGTV